MAGFNVSEADNYGGQGGGGFFSLRNDNQVARVRILYRDVEDVTGYSVHEVEINGKKRYVNCLRSYGDPVDACPFCKAGKFTTVKYFIPLFVEALKDSAKATTETPVGSLQVWERGKQFGSKITSLCSRFPNLVSHLFEIERHGKPKDTNTSYEIFEVGDDNKTIEDFEVANPLGTIILDKSADEMVEFLRTGNFPKTNGGNAGGDTVSRDSAPSGYVRRTPAGTGRREAFD